MTQRKLESSQLEIFFFFALVTGRQLNCRIVFLAKMHFITCPQVRNILKENRFVLRVWRERMVY